MNVLMHFELPYEEQCLFHLLGQINEEIYRQRGNDADQGYLSCRVDDYFGPMWRYDWGYLFNTDYLGQLKPCLIEAAKLGLDVLKDYYKESPDILQEVENLCRELDWEKL